MRKLIFIVVILFISGCSSLEDKKLENAARIYINKLLIEEKFPDIPDSVTIMQEKLYSRYKTSKEEYQNFFSTLGRDKDKWDAFFSFAEKYFDSLKNTKNFN